MYAEREARREATRRAFDQLQYELMHNLVIETTRMSIEVKNLKMRVESLASRLEFNERRARALESVVVYRPGEETADVLAPSSGQTAGRPSTPREPQGRPEYGPGASASGAREAQRPEAGRGPAVSTPPVFRDSQDAGRAAAGSPGVPAGSLAGQGPATGAGRGPGEGPGQRSRRRRRRRGRRGGG
jgi:hypothetical protein